MPKKRRTAKQIAAFKRMQAGLRRWKRGNAPKSTPRKQRPKSSSSSTPRRNARPAPRSSGVRSMPKKSSKKQGSSKGSRKRRGFTLGGFLPSDALTVAAGATAGFLGAQYLVDKAAPADFRTGDKRIASKAAAAAVIFAAGKRVNRKFAGAASIGALTSVGLDLVARFTAKGGVSGVGHYRPSAELPDGVGDYDDEDISGMVDELDAAYA